MKRLLHGLGMLGLTASIAGGCSSRGGIGHDSGDQAGPQQVPSSSSGGSPTTTDADSSPLPDAGLDSGSDAGIDSGVDSGSISGDSGTMGPPSCQAGGNGVTRCGASGESCCTSPEVPGGTYYRTYASSGSGPTGEADPATVSGFWWRMTESFIHRTGTPAAASRAAAACACTRSAPGPGTPTGSRSPFRRPASG